MTGYFQKPMTIQQAEIFKALAFLNLPVEYFVACTEDIYVFLEQTDPALDKTFNEESKKLHENFTHAETKPIIAEYLRQQGKEFSDDESFLKELQAVDIRAESMLEFVGRIRDNRQALTQRMDGLAKEIFGANILTGTEILKADAIGRKAARDYLNISDDGKVAATPITE